MMRAILVAAVMLVLVLAVRALAAPPENADPQLAPWFQGLQQPNGGSCCSVADCRPVDSRTVGDHYEALMEGGALAADPRRQGHSSEEQPDRPRRAMRLAGPA